MSRTILRVRMFLSIVERGNGRPLADWLAGKGITFQYRFHGRGTASSEMMDILGVGSSEKDILISFGNEYNIASVAWELSEMLGNIVKGRGIMMLMAPDAMSSLVAMMLTGEGKAQNIQPEVKRAMKSEYKHSLILVAVNQGYTEQVMETARQAGATGGTVIRARLSDGNQSEQLYGITLQAEKEIIAIMASEQTRDRIMEAVNREHGIKSQAQSMLCSLPVDRAFKI